MAGKGGKGKKKRAGKRALRGRGDYVDDLIVNSGPAARALKEVRDEVKALKGSVNKMGSTGVSSAMKMAGGALGGAFGMPVLGSRAGGALAALLGHGDYEVRVNSLMGKVPKDSHVAGAMVPFFSKEGRHGVRVTEREYLGDIITAANGAFKVQTFRINPGLNSSFPWLSTVAQQFEEWQPLGLVYEFVSTSASYGGGSSQALGAVAMATDYDVLDPTYSSMIQLQNEEAACSTRSSENLVHGVECDLSERGRRVFFCRSGPPPTGSTLMDYDLGVLSVATQGSPTAAATTVGQLWVSYDVAFYKKNLYGGQLGLGVLSCYMSQTGSLSGVVNATPFGPLSTLAVQGTMYVAMSGNTLTFPSWLVTGTFEIMILWQGASTASVIVANPTTTNCVLPPVNGPQYGYGTLYYPGTATTSTTAFIYAMVNITGPSAKLTFSGLNLPTSMVNFFVTISQQPYWGTQTWSLMTSDVG